MKAQKYIIVILAGIIVSACSKMSFAPEDVRQDTEMMEFAISARSRNSTRTYTDGKDVWWEVGDTIWVGSTEYELMYEPVPFVYDGEYFRGAVILPAGEYEFYAFNNYGEVNRYYEGLWLDIPYDQNSTADKPLEGIAKNDMLGCLFSVELPTHSPVCVEMHHFTHQLEVEIKNGTSYDLNLNNLDVQLHQHIPWGIFDVDYKNILLTHWGDYPQREAIWMNLSGYSLAPGESTKVYCTIAPVKAYCGVAGFLIQTNHGSYEILKDVSNVNFNAGECSSASVVLSEEKLSSIRVRKEDGAWVTGDNLSGSEETVKNYIYYYDGTLTLDVYEKCDWLEILSPEITCSRNAPTEFRFKVSKNEGDSSRNANIIFRDGTRPVLVLKVFQYGLDDSNE